MQEIHLPATPPPLPRRRNWPAWGMVAGYLVFCAVLVLHAGSDRPVYWTVVNFLAGMLLVMIPAGIVFLIARRNRLALNAVVAMSLMLAMVGQWQRFTEGRLFNSDTVASGGQARAEAAVQPMVDAAKPVEAFKSPAAAEPVVADPQMGVEVLIAAELHSETSEPFTRFGWHVHDLQQKGMFRFGTPPERDRLREQITLLEQANSELGSLRDMLQGMPERITHRLESRGISPADRAAMTQRIVAKLSLPDKVSYCNDLQTFIGQCVQLLRTLDEHWGKWSQNDAGDIAISDATLESKCLAIRRQMSIVAVRIQQHALSRKKPPSAE